MSYILDALRKSERQRRIHEAPTLQSAMLSPPPRRRRWLVWLAAAMAAVNAGTLMYWWLHDPADALNDDASKGAIQGDSTRLAPAHETALTGRSGAASALTRSLANSESGKVDRTSPKTLKAVASDDGARSSSTKLVADPARTPGPKVPAESRNANATQVRARKAPDRLAPPAQPETPPRKSPVDSGKSEIQASPFPVLGDPEERPAAERTATAEKQPWFTRRDEEKRPLEGREEIVPEPGSKAELPLLRMLPGDFRRRMPSMNINVHVYAEDPGERFVVIDMVKYRAGQRIADGPLLEDITANDLVLSFEGRRFRIERP